MKRDLIITALLTFCLTATVFMVATSNSAEYDPWVDLNGDGKIDIFDVVQMTSRYGATGDSTKNVTITNWRTGKLAYSIVTSMNATSAFYSPWIPVDGYTKISICLWNSATDNRFVLTTKHSGLANTYNVETLDNLAPDFAKTYDVPNQEIQVLFANKDSGTRILYLDVYLIP